MTVLRRVPITPPTPAITLEEAKAQVRPASDGADDAELWEMVREASDYVEGYCGRAFGPQTWEVVLDAFPSGDIELEWGPLVSVTSIKYLDADGVEQTVSASLYEIERGHPVGVIRLLDAWPSPKEAANAVVVRYVAGDGWPLSVKRAVKLLVSHYYDNRGAVAAKLEEVPLGVCANLLRHRRMFV